MRGRVTHATASKDKDYAGHGGARERDLEHREQKTENRRQKTEDREQKTEDREQKTENREQKMAAAKAGYIVGLVEGPEGPLLPPRLREQRTENSGRGQ